MCHTFVCMCVEGHSPVKAGMEDRGRCRGVFPQWLPPMALTEPHRPFQVRLDSWATRVPPIWPPRAVVADTCCCVLLLCRCWRSEWQSSPLQFTHPVIPPSCLTVFKVIYTFSSWLHKCGKWLHQLYVEFPHHHNSYFHDPGKSTDEVLFYSVFPDNHWSALSIYILHLFSAHLSKISCYLPSWRLNEWMHISLAHRKYTSI